MTTLHNSLLSSLIIFALTFNSRTAVSASTALLPFLAKQSGPDYGNSYGNSVKIDPYHNRIFVTGATYGNFWSDNDNEDGDSDADVREYELSGNSRCFLGVYDWSVKKWVAKKTFRSKNPSKTTKINESCHKIEIVNNGTKVLLLGYTHSNGILDDLMELSSSVLNPPRQYGMILDIDVTNTDQKLKIDLIGGQLLQDGPVQYPIDMALIPKNKDTDKNNHDANANDLFVVSMQSYDNTSNEKKNTNAVIYQHPHHSQQQILHPNYNEKTHFRYGSTSSLLAERFSYAGGQQQQQQQQQQLSDTYNDMWREIYGTENMQNTVDIVGVIPDIFSDNNNIIVIGNTAETNYIYGNPTSSVPPPESNRDGFITKLDQSHGKMIQEVRDGRIEHAALRIESEDYQDDEINGYCYDKENLYLVGTTMGKMIGTDNNHNNKISDIHHHAFIVAVDLQTFGIKWTTQVSGTSMVHGITCSVSLDNSSSNNSNEQQHILHWGGNIYNGGSIILDKLDSDSNRITKMMPSAGGDDIFISQLSTVDGTINHLHQWGTNHDDSLADIQSDSNGNIIVMGNTNGGVFHHPVKVQACEPADTNTATTESSSIAGGGATQNTDNDSDTLTDVFFFTLDSNFARLQLILATARSNKEEEDFNLNLDQLCNDEGTLFDKDDDPYYNEENEGDDEYNSGSDDGDEEYSSSSDEGDDDNEADDQYYLEFDDDKINSDSDNETVLDSDIDENKNIDTVETNEEIDDNEAVDKNKPNDEIAENKYYDTGKPNDESKNNETNKPFGDEIHDHIDYDIATQIDESTKNKNTDTGKQNGEIDDNKDGNTRTQNGENEDNAKDVNIISKLFSSSASTNTKKLKPKPKQGFSNTSKFLVGTLVVVILFACCTWNSSDNTNKGPYDVPTDKKHIAKYLHDFDSNEVDLRHSATGGWHGAYQSDLAEGINTMDPNAGLFPGWRRGNASMIKPTTTISSFSNHSINKNSQKYGELPLFTDDEEKPKPKQKSYKDGDEGDTTEEYGNVQLIDFGDDITDEGSRALSYNYDGFEDDDDDDKSWMVEDRLVEDYYLNDHDNSNKSISNPVPNEETGSFLDDNIGDII